MDRKQATVRITLNETLEAIDVKRNAVAVEGKIRPATVSELCSGKSKAISFETLEKIVNALNSLDQDGKQHGIEDVLTIEYKEKDPAK